jgi:hypothetical protein
MRKVDASAVADLGRDGEVVRSSAWTSVLRGRARGDPGSFSSSAIFASLRIWSVMRAMSEGNEGNVDAGGY